MSMLNDMLNSKYQSSKCKSSFISVLSIAIKNLEMVSVITNDGRNIVVSSCSFTYLSIPNF